jgi:RimJ/RimL family protein N-acetyltransferase
MPSSSRSGWAFEREAWNQGYATESASACRDHAFGELGSNRVISLIAEENVVSIRVAQKIGETLERENVPGPFREKVDPMRSKTALSAASTPTLRV